MQRAVQQAGITRTPNFVASRCPGAPTPAGSCSCVRARSANIWATPHGYKSRHYRSTIEGAQVHLAAQHKTHTSMAVCGRRSGGRRHLVGAGLTLLLQIGLLVFFFFFQASPARESKPVLAGVGVKQGDSLAPVLFNVYFQACIEVLDARWTAAKPSFCYDEDFNTHQFNTHQFLAVSPTCTRSACHGHTDMSHESLRDRRTADRASMGTCVHFVRACLMISMFNDVEAARN